jgi:hypothetical protein
MAAGYVLIPLPPPRVVPMRAVQGDELQDILQRRLRAEPCGQPREPVTPRPVRAHGASHADHDIRKAARFGTASGFLGGIVQTTPHIPSRDEAAVRSGSPVALHEVRQGVRDGDAERLSLVACSCQEVGLGDGLDRTGGDGWPGVFSRCHVTMPL